LAALLPLLRRLNWNWKEMNCIDWLGLYPPELFGLDRVELIISLGFERVRFFCTVNSSLLRGQGSSSVTDDLIPDCLEIQ
jgi:hypothetical protein